MFKSALIGLALCSPVNAIEQAAIACDTGCCASIFSQTPNRQDNTKSHDGKVVSASDGKLVMTDKDGKNQHQHQVTGAARILVDGMAARLMDLKAGDVVKVTISTEGEVMLIEATRKSV